MPERHPHISEIYSPYLRHEHAEFPRSFDQAVREKVLTASRHEIAGLIDYESKEMQKYPKTTFVRLWRLHEWFGSSFDPGNSADLLDNMRKICQDADLNFRHPALQKKFLELAGDTFARSCGHTVPLGAIAKVLNALSAMKIEDRTLFTKASQHIGTYSNISPAHISIIANAYVSAGLRPQKLFAHLARAARHKAEEMNLKEMASILGAFGKAGYSHAKLSSALIDNLSEKLAKKDLFAGLEQNDFSRICLGLAAGNLELGKVVWEELLPRFEERALNEIQPGVVTELYRIGLAVGAEIRPYMPSVSEQYVKRQSEIGQKTCFADLEGLLHRLKKYTDITFERNAAIGGGLVDFAITLPGEDCPLRIALLTKENRDFFRDPLDGGLYTGGEHRFELLSLRKLGYVTLVINSVDWECLRPHQKLNKLQAMLHEITVNLNSKPEAPAGDTADSKDTA